MQGGPARELLDISNLGEESALTPPRCSSWSVGHIPFYVPEKTEQPDVDFGNTYHHLCRAPGAPWSVLLL